MSLVTKFRVQLLWEMPGHYPASQNISSIVLSLPWSQARPLMLETPATEKPDWCLILLNWLLSIQRSPECLISLSYHIHDLVLLVTTHRSWPSIRMKFVNPYVSFLLHFALTRVRYLDSSSGSNLSQHKNANPLCYDWEPLSRTMSRNP